MVSDADDRDRCDAVVVRPDATRFVVALEQAGALDGSAVGAKAARLADLVQHGFPVPAGFVVTADAYRASMERHDAALSLERCFETGLELDDPEAQAERAAVARATIFDQGPDPAVEDAVRTAYAELADRAGTVDPPVAVRSSATLEDLPDASFAGQQDTFLWIRGADDVVHHVVRCWASLYTDRAVAYRMARDLPSTAIDMAVVVQMMVSPVSAGVALTLDPITGDTRRMVIESAFGLGESVVGGDVTPDQFVVDRRTGGIVRSVISAKEREVVVADDRIGRRDLEPERSRRASLSDDDVRRLVELLERVESHCGQPQDIEWARLADDADGPGRIMVLQSRPETVWSRRSVSGSHPVATASVPYLSPYDVADPDGAAGWRSMYPPSLVFDDDGRDPERFWFRDGMHWSRALAPLEVTLVQFAMTSLSQFNARHFLVPAALGLDVRLVNGYCFLSPISIEEPEEILARSAAFAERSAVYYTDWDARCDRWRDDVRAVIAEMEAVRFEPLPEIVTIDDVRAGRAVGPPAELTQGYHRLLDGCLRLWQYHFEFLNLGYAAYVEFFAECTDAFPGVTDLSVARMVAGIDGELFRPDRELRRLARRAVDEGLSRSISEGTVDDALERMSRIPEAAAWWADYRSIHDPWFNYSAGSGMYHDDPVWRDRPEIPFGFVQGYVAKLIAGEQIDAPVEAVAAERDRLVEEYRGRLVGEARQRFDDKLALARTVSHYVENHNFYVEHWGLSVFWRKIRELSAVFVDAGFWKDETSIVMLRREEIAEALWDLVTVWASGRPGSAGERWEAEADRRRATLAACEAWSPPTVLGRVPDLVSEPFTVMLWGITTESARGWSEAARSGERELRGFGASSGTAVGRARVILRPQDVGTVKAGEVLVTALTAPSWAPVFCRVAATVTDTGGMMSHAAIVCREYGLPAVTGTGVASRTIRTGDLLHVDGNTGRVTILDENHTWTS